jgi:hypothetical protein
MARRLVVVTEAVADVADLGDPAREALPALGRRRCVGGARGGLVVAGLQRILRQHVLDVGEHQLLVLLLVVQAQRDQEPNRLVPTCDQSANGLVDVAPIGQHGRHGRAG